MPYLATLLIVIAAYVMVSEQTPFLSSSAWTLRIDPVWDVLGPFPIHAREQHFMSPSFPLNLSEPIDYQQMWPSSYADGGLVGWSKANIGVDGYLELSFPDIRWKSLRSYEGWAALQHHAVLRTTLTLQPPSDPIANSIRLLFDLKQVSYFTIIPQDGSPASPEWHAGNIYDMERALPELVELPTDPSLSNPTKYDLFVSGDYEIRLFGDPLVRNSNVPVQRLGIRVEVPSSTSPVIHQSTQDVSCDFLDGYAFGDALGIGIQSAAGWWTVKAVSATNNQTGLDILLSDVSFTIAPSQTRILPVRIHQTTPFFGETITFDLTLESGTDSQILSISMPITQRRLREITGRQVLKGSFFFASSMPSSFLTTPPSMTNVSSAYPPVLALHGAGVDILGQPFWPEALPENKFSWTVIPTGRTSWGLDWRGPSARDAWASLDALSVLTQRREFSLPEGWVIPPDTKVIVIGHSNGGQGTWYFASRYPDKVIAAVPAAAYIKSQAYIPLTLARSGHFIDPSLRAILESSLTPDDNDLHMSNLVDTRVLAIHGGDDENVPVWHTRELSSALKAWYPSANISFQEDAGQGHWYSNVLDNPKTLEFLNDAISNHDNEEPLSRSFTLTVSLPQDSGPLRGWKIKQLTIPGRLGWVHVNQIGSSIFVVETTNVCCLTVPSHPGPLLVTIDEEALSLAGTGSVHLCKDDTTGSWQSRLSTSVAPIPGRLQSVLSTAAPLVVIFSTVSEKENLSIAIRLAHVLNLYHRLDVEIVSESEAIDRNKRGTWTSGNIVFIGTPASPLARETLEQQRTPVRIVDSIVHLGSRRFRRPGQAILFTHPHPSQTDSFMVFLLANDKAGLERAARLFPFRTGVAVPDWVIVGDRMDAFSAGGIEGAGVWDASWDLSASMSWFSR